MFEPENGSEREVRAFRGENTGSGGQMPPPPRKKGFSNLLPVLLLGALLCLGLGGVAGWQIGKGSASQTPLVGDNSDTYRSGLPNRVQVIAQGRQAVVQINVTTGQGNSVGSGVIIDQQGDIVTNNHVISGGQKFQVVLFDGSVLSAQLVGADPPDDLAVIKITPPKRLYSMPIGDSSQLAVGDDVLAIGNPLGITQTVTGGIVSALGRTVPEGQGNAVIIDAVQTDAAINPGNSGGALVNMQGQLVGIPTLVPVDPEFKTPANGVGFAIPANRVKFIVPQLIQNGKITHSGRPAIGATVATVDSLVAEQAGLSVDQGALIVSVEANGPAATAGLKRGDVIVRVDNLTIENTTDLTDALVTKNPGDTVTLGIVRGDQQMQVRLKLGELKIP
ncbi:MAG TPA: trypsin-like peptidase domain-containing protein [Ktedonobacteraceae bacterium]|nr:trypsin-like peptidase domain-containing protein [Ktedonobacteraceae bacterium]